MRYTLYHTHPNPKHGEDEPLFLIVDGLRCPSCTAPKSKSNRRVMQTLHDAVEVKVKLPKFPEGIEKLKIPFEASVGKTWKTTSKLKPGSIGDILAFAFLKLAQENNNIVTYEQAATLCPAYPGDPALWAREAGAQVTTERKNKRYVVVKSV